MENECAPIDRRTTSTVSRPTVRSTSLAAARLMGGFLCAVVAYPLLAPILCATVPAVLVFSLHQWVKRRLEYPSIAAAFVVGVVALSIVVFFGFTVAQLLQEIADGASRLQSSEASRLWQDALARHPQLATLIEWVDQRVDLKSLVGQWTGGAAMFLQGLLAGSIASAAGWLIMFFMLFLFLRDRVRMLASVERFLPLTGAETHEVFKVTADAIQATVNGTLAVGLVQGTLGGLKFWWLELPTRLFWGVLIGIVRKLRITHWLWPKRFSHRIGMLRVGRITHGLRPLVG